VERMLFTIGHSNHPIERLIALALQHGITAIADVRSSPYSRYNPQYNKRDLQAELLRHGIHYVFLGNELGARPDNPECYVNGQVSYEKLANTVLFKQGVDRIIKGMKSYRISILCAEKDPLQCHRTILVCRQLAIQGIKIAHILETGLLEFHEEAEERLLREETHGPSELFRTRNEILSEAFYRRELKLAYTGNKTDIQSEEAAR
jgi:uncharacterized protein (DUF488 family)